MKLVAGACGGVGSLGAAPIRLPMVPKSTRPRRLDPLGDELCAGNLLMLLPGTEWFPDQGSCVKMFSPWNLTYFAS